MAGESRKTVTVVFTDVTGSTSLGEQLDPEALRGVMGRYFETAQTVLEKHGGTVEKFIGDAVMAVFGIPQLHEDDALRAVRAAAELRERMEALNAELERERGVRIALRTGINTGEVVAGDPSGGQFYATGDAVNVAARLEQTADPGEILIADATYRLVREAVSVEPVDSLELKGKADAVPAWRLAAVPDGGPAVSRRLDAPLVGRQEEFARLQEAYERTRDDRRPGLCTVIGAPGVGKSRLAGELVSRVGPEATALWGRCLSYGEGITFWPLVEILRELDIAGPLAGLENKELIEEHVSGLLGERPAGNLEETFWAIRKLFEALAWEKPLVVVFDDVHWAEPAFLDFVEHLVEWSQDAPIFVVALARPEFIDERPLWAAQREDFTLVRLEPLSQGEAELLIENLSGEASLPEALRRRITEASEGNPLFVEQMVAMLAENGRRNGGDLAVPATIQALLSARLDQLAPDERAVVEPAAVVGKEFWRSAVVELAPADLQVSASLQRLVRKEFIRPDRSLLAGEDGFRFRHVLIRDAAYAAISKGQRARLHERFADWLASRYPEFEEIVGYHLEQAYRYAQELGPARAEAAELAHRAAGQLSAAGLRAWEGGDMRAAVNLLERSVALLPRGDGLRLALLPELGSALENVGRLEEAEALLDEAAREAAEAGDRRAEMRARIEFALAHFAHADYPALDKIQPLADEAIPVFEQFGDDAGLAATWELLSYPGWAGMRWQEMAEAIERALAHARRAGSRVRVGKCLAWLSACYAFGPLPVDEAIARTEEIRAEFEPGTFGDAGALVFLGWLEAMRGDFSAGRKLYRRGIDRFVELGAMVRRGGRSIAGGDIELLAGDPVAAEAELREGFRILSEMREQGLLSTVASDLAAAVYEQGRYDEAWKLTRISEEASAPEDMASQVGWRGVRAKVLARRGEFDEAERLSLEALSLIERTDAVPQQAGTLMSRAEVLSLAGRVDEAKHALEEAIRRCEAKGMVAGVKNGRARLSELSG